jgi:hypothetical protein
VGPIWKRVVRRPAIGLVSGLLLLCGEAARAQPDLGKLDGAWEGSVAIVGASADLPGGLTVEDELEIRLELKPDTAQAFVLLSQWHALLVRRVARNGPSAIVICDALTEHGAETWVLTVTKRDASSMLMFVARSIRSDAGSFEGDERPIAMQASGELRAATR